jgi:hypothetical protein
MSKTTDLAPLEPALPALANTPSAAPLDSSDVAFPRLYKGEGQSAFVQEGKVPKGSIFTASGGDDPDPEVLVENAFEDSTKGVLVHVLSVTKNLSHQEQGGEFRTWPWGDKSAHPDARKGYQYVVCLPEDTPGIPVKLTLAKTSTKCAERINFRLMQHTTGGPHELAFRLKLVAKKSEKDGQKFFWYVWSEAFEDADKQHVVDAEKLARLVASIKPDDTRIERSEPADLPAI